LGIKANEGEGVPSPKGGIFEVQETAQYNMLRMEVEKRGADPSNIAAEIKRLAERIKAERRGGDGRNLLDLSESKGYSRCSGYPV